MGSREAIQPTISDEVLDALETYKKKDTNKSEFHLHLQCVQSLIYIPPKSLFDSKGLEMPRS